MLLPYEASPLHVGLMGPFPELTLHLAVASSCHLHAFLQLCVLGVPRCRLTQSLCTLPAIRIPKIFSWFIFHASQVSAQNHPIKEAFLDL